MTPSPKMLIVAISGKQRSGKTYCAEHLVLRGFMRKSFAAPLKDDIRGMGFPEEDIQDKPPYMRALMQVYGQARRAVDPDHWAEQLRIDIANLFASWTCAGSAIRGELELRVVIDDMRFPNEFEMLKKLGEDPNIEVRHIRMRRLGDPGDVSNTEEISETALDGRDDWWQVFPVESGDLYRLDRAAELMAR